MADDDEEMQQIKIFKVKKLIQMLEAARGNGTSMISLIIRPKDEVSRAQRMLTEEYGTASNIKSRVNRLSVLSAITSTQERLKHYNRVPENGLVVYCGTVITDEGKERKVTFDFEPFKPINTSLYLCDNKFHTEALQELLSDDKRYGFIVMDGHGCLYGTLSGNTRTVLHKFSVDLPKKHGRGGQSAQRFARLRMEKRHNYVRKCAETAVQFFIDGPNARANVNGLVLAGSADFKTELAQSDLFDLRLKAIIVAQVDVSYGGLNGFNQAIELSSETLGNVKFLQEKKLISSYFDEISQDTGRYCFGVRDTMMALDMGAVEKLIVFENLEMQRLVLRRQGAAEDEIPTIKYLTKKQMDDPVHFKCADEEGNQCDLEITEQESLVEWIAENFKKFGCTLDFVTDNSQEGSQFVRGFGGIGGIIRWQVDFEEYEDVEDISDEDDDLDAFL
jgi:peptide chain release factor subunit 1|eukprot:SAG25_NODE_393_length_8567_cov_15.363368_15_plen_447_part_00